MLIMYIEILLQQYYLILRHLSCINLAIKVQVLELPNPLYPLYIVSPHSKCAVRTRFFSLNFKKLTTILEHSFARYKI